MQDTAIEAQIDELLTIAGAAFDEGRVEVTENILQGLRSLTRTHVEVNKRLGILLANKGDFQGARAPLEDAVLLDESDDIVFFVLSACAFDMGDYEAALGYADSALRLKRTSADAHGNRGNALLRLGRHAEALEAMKAAQMLNPRDPNVYVNLANVLTALARHAEAAHSLERAIALNPRIAAAHMNHGNVLERLGRYSEAIAAYGRAIELDPGAVDAHFNQGVLQLLLGDYAAGWRGYEWRWRRDLPASRSRRFPQPLWLGQEDIGGRTILLHGEQGFGDCIQFARYVRAVADRGAKVVLEVYPALTRLFRDLDGVTDLVPRGDPLPGFDLHCPLMSLPAALGRAAPAPDPAPYLEPLDEDVEAWAERLGPARAPRIGLVVSGSAAHLNDANRSLSFETLARHLPAGPEYHLLQQEVREGDAEALAARADVRVWCGRLSDFADTAGLAQHMELVVSVDTSIAHLAGAIGRPTALLLPAVPDWRWGLGVSETPWYAGMRLYRQRQAGDWDAPLQRLAADLSARLPI